MLATPANIVFLARLAVVVVDCEILRITIDDADIPLPPMNMGACIILTEQQCDVTRWYWQENRTLREIAGWMGCSVPKAKVGIATLRAVYASHGIDLPRFDKGRPKTMPPLCSIPVS